MGNCWSKKLVVDYERRRPPFKKTSKICVIGAGPAGIHMASLLKKSGIKNVAVLERSHRIGGKSHTVTDVDGVPHEMGTCYLHSGYGPIKDLIKEYGAGKTRPLSDSDDNRDVLGADLADIDGDGHPDHVAVDFGDWVFSATEKQTLPKLLHWLPDKLQAVAIFGAIKRYTNIHERIFGRYAFSLPPEPNDLSEISMTFLEFLKKHNLEALIPMLVYSQSVQGYGLLREVPALYGLMWNTPLIVNEVIDIVDNYINDESLLEMMEDGFQQLWEKIAAKEKLDVRFGIKVEDVVRKDDGVTVKFTQPVHQDAGEAETKTDSEFVYPTLTASSVLATHEEEFDFLVVASPMIEAGEFVQFTEMEKKFVGAMRWGTLATTLYEIPKDVAEDKLLGAAVQFFPTVLERGNGHLYAQRNSRKSIRPKQTASDRERIVAYQYWNQPPIGDDVSNIVKNDIHELLDVDRKDISVLEHENWPYFAQFSQEAIDKAYPWKLRDLQGGNRTWWIGSNVCFESVLDVVNYNHMLFDMFCMDNIL